MHLGGLREVHGVVPAGHRHRVGVLLAARLRSDELALDPHLLPVLGVADAHVPEFLDQLLLADLYLLVGVTEDAVVALPLLLLHRQQRVGVPLQRNELVLVELLLLDVVEDDDMLVFEVFGHHLAEVGVGDFLDVGGAAGEVVEDVADLQVVQAQVLLVQLGVGLLEQVDPNFVGAAGGELGLGERLAGDEVVDGDALPLAVLAQPQPVYAVGVDLVLVEEEPLQQRLVGQRQAHHHRIKGVVG